MIKFESYKNWINEKFTEDADPIESMGIGMMHEIDKFIEQQQSFEPRNNYDKLIICVRKNKVEFVDYLIPVYKSEPSFRPDAINNYIMYVAISAKAIDVVKLLVEKYNADIHANDSTPIYYSLAYFSSFPIFKYFVEELGLDVNEQNGRWFLMVCRQKIM